MTSRLSVGSGLAGASGLLLLAAAYMDFVYAPEDSVEHAVQRVFYLHFGAAMMAYLCFGIVLVASVVYLVRDSAEADRVARAAAPVGLLFTAVVLVVGSIWAKPIWGTYWTWDPRLTSTLVMGLVYAGYLMVRRLAIGERQAARLGAVVGIVGAADVPVVHFSVTWWRSLHPPLSAGTSDAMVPQMWLAVLVTLVAILVVAVALLRLSYDVERLRDLDRAAGG